MKKNKNNEIKFNNTPNRYYNFSGKLVWESRSPAVVGVIVAKYKNNDYILIGQRGEGAADNHGLWNVPCGYLDWNETGTEGVIREIYEETGLYINDIKNIKINKLKQPFYVNTSTSANKQNVSLSYGLYFKCDELPELSTKNSEPGEVSDVKWVKISDIDNYEFAFKHRERIKSFIKIIKKDKLNIFKKIKKFFKKNYLISFVLIVMFILFTYLHGVLEGLVMTSIMGLFYWFLYKF